MRRSVGIARLLMGFSLAIVAAGELPAQSVLSTRGLGFPAQPVDARARALGGTAAGLPGAEITWANPASAVGLLAPGLVFGYQYDSFSADDAADSFSGKSVRFPLVLAAIPAGERFVVQAGFGSFLDQNWRIIERDTLYLTPDTVAVQDWWQSEGGVTRLRFAVGAAVVSNLSVGVALDAYTGSANRLLGRAFPGEGRPACCATEWNFRGLGGTVGAHWSPGNDMGAGISVGFGGTLEADPRDSTGVASEFSLPLTVNGGASGRIAENLLVVVGGSWEGWSTLNPAMTDRGGARDSWSIAAGVEWDGATIGGTTLPLRLGVRSATLPFAWDDGAEAPAERALSFGTGLQLAGGAVLPSAFAEFGARDSGGLEESFWRFGLSVRVLGR
jgi:hypothetical protein